MKPLRISLILLMVLVSMVSVVYAEGPRFVIDDMRVSPVQDNLRVPEEADSERFLSGQSNYLNSLVPDDDVAVYVHINNTGDSGQQRVEVLFNRRDTINSWYAHSTVKPFTLAIKGEPIGNCVENEPNVATKLVSLGKGESVWVYFPIKLTGVSSQFSLPSSQFGFLAQAFKRCYAEDVDPGITSWRAKRTVIVAGYSNQKPGTCFDRMRNNLETGIDCGGFSNGQTECSACANYNECERTEDCLSANCVAQKDGRKICMPKTEEQKKQEKEEAEKEKEEQQNQENGCAQKGVECNTGLDTTDDEGNKNTGTPFKLDKLQENMGLVIIGAGALLLLVVMMKKK